MYALPRVTRPAFLAALVFGSVLPAGAQVTVPRTTVSAPADGVDRTAWLYKGSDIVPDPGWHFGTLPNGLRYAVRKNGVPPGQVSVRVRIDAGSLMESESERGYAHLIEHLSFRGSEHVPDGEAKRVWQRMGTTFGSDTNAQTTPTHTVYKLDLPSATEAGLDESLKIMAGMVRKPSITAQALAAERPAVLAEQREQPGPQVRFGDMLRQTFFAGQPLADRSPIGNIKTLDAATATSVGAFHDRWYRPERAVVVVAGDLDPALFERLVIKNFAGWRGTGPKPAEPDFGKPDPKQPASNTIVEPGLPPIVALAVLRPWQYQDDTALFNQNRLVDTLAAQLISRRLETRARAGGSFLTARASLEDVSRSANGTFVNIVPIGDDWEAALRDVRAVIADAKAAPPSQAEIDRELADIDTQMRTRVETSRSEPGGAQADDLVQAVDIRETTTAAQTAYAILRDARARKFFTPARVLASTRRIFQGNATRAVINTRTPDATVAAKLATALNADVSGFAGKRKAQAKVDFSKLPRLGKPATIVSREKIADLDMEKIVFSNGVRLMVFANASETNRVYVRVGFGGGYNALPAGRATPAWAADLALVQGGIGSLRQGDLEQLTAGRRIGLDFGVGEDSFSYSAQTSPADLADQLRLIAARMAAPGWDPNPIARAKSVIRAGYPGFEASPDGVLSRDLEGLLHAGDPRWGTPSLATVEATTPVSFRALWAPLLETGPVEVQVFGDIKADDAIAAVARSIGALKPRAAAPVAAPPVRFPAHVAAPLIRTHSGPSNQAAAVIAWPTGGGIDDISASRRLDVLAAIFSDRLFDRLRSEAGASYSPNVSSQWPVGMASGGRLIAIGQVAPDKVGFFFTLAREIAADLVAKPVGDDELQRILVPMKQAVIRQSTGNQFWLQQLAGATYDDRRIASLRGLFRDLATITAPQLQDTARKYLRPETDWTMAVVPKAAAGSMAGK